MYMFGSGALYGVPTADSAGNAITNPTPVQFGVLQDVSIDISFETKMLHGQSQFPVATGRGKGKVGGKAKFANVNGQLWNSMFFGQSMSNGIVAAVTDTTGVAIPGTPFQITVTPPNSGTFLRDLGVIGPGGVPFTRVASAPGVGQYSLAGAVYTFAAADTGKIVFINYEYTGTSTTAKQFNVTNQLMGYSPQFMIVLAAPYQAKNFHLRLPACQSSKLSLALKNDDFTIPEMDFDAYADANGIVATFGLTD